MAKPFFTLAKVKVSNEHDYMRFAFIVLYTVAVGIAIFWAWYAGYLTRMIVGMGVACTIIFFVLLIGVVLLAWVLGFRCSRDINVLKKVARDPKALLLTFGMEHYDENGFDFVCRQVDRMTDRALRTLVSSEEVVLQAGFVGMMIGMIVALSDFHGLASFNQDTIGALMPKFFVGLMISIWSALASIFVWFAIAGFKLLIHNSHDIFAERADRAFYNLPKDLKK